MISTLSRMPRAYDTAATSSISCCSNLRAARHSRIPPMVVFVTAPTTLTASMKTSFSQRAKAYPSPDAPPRPSLAPGMSAEGSPERLVHPFEIARPMGFGAWLVETTLRMGPSFRVIFLSHVLRICVTIGKAAWGRATESGTHE
jgi:hypothetical protein